jgi:hypothetical protein
MKAEEKAKELFDKLYTPFYEWVGNGYREDIETSVETTKRNVLIACDEIIQERSDKHFSYYDDAINQKIRLKYWEEVKQEIEKL